MSTQQNIQDKLVAWADETARCYDEMASDKGVNLSFYTQSPLMGIHSSPRLLVAGINPGSDATYKTWRDNPNWNLQKAVSGSHLLQGNHCWKSEEDHQTAWERRQCEWPYWSRLLKYFPDYSDIMNVDIPSEFVLTNLSFYATKKANKISMQLLENTIPFTVGLIKILRPRRMAFLGAKSFDTLRKVNGHLPEKDKFSFEGKMLFRGICAGLFEGIPCYGLLHPSAHGMTNEYRKLVAIVIKVLDKVFDDRQISSIDEINVDSVKNVCKAELPTLEEKFF